MESLRRYLQIILIGMMLILSAGCSESSLKDIYKDNARIVAEGDSYNFKERLGSTLTNKLNVKFNTFYGMETIWVIDTLMDGQITFDFDSKISRGEFKALLILPNNEILDIFEQSKKGSLTLNIRKGKNRVKIVGNGASGEVELVPKLDSQIGKIQA